MGFAMYAGNIDRRRKKVLYEGTSTIREGMPLCYNYDTTTNVTGYSKSEGGEVDCQTTPTTTDEGYQNEGKYLRVEDVTAANSFAFAGVVASGSWCGTTGTGDKWIEIYIPNGSIVPVWTDKSVTIKDPLYLEPGQTTFTDVAVGRFVGISMETVDRSSTAGIVLALVDVCLEATEASMILHDRAAAALPTSAVWQNFDLGSLKNTSGSSVLDVDFTKTLDEPTDTFIDTAMTATILPGAAGIGEYAIFTTTDNLAVESQWNVPIDLDGGPWAFEALVKASQIANTKAGWVIGLGARAANLTGDVIADDGTLTDGGFLGFQNKEGDGDIIDFVYDDASQTQNEHDDDYHTLVADTYVKLGMYYNGTTIQGYVNGTATGTAISAVDIAAADFPADLVLVPTFAVKAAANDDVTITMDWIRVAQLDS